MRCVGAKWMEEEGKWKVSVENVDTRGLFEDECDILISCTGFRLPRRKVDDRLCE